MHTNWNVSIRVCPSLPRFGKQRVALFWLAGVMVLLVSEPLNLSAEGINLTWKDNSRIEEAYHVEREIAGGEGFEPLVDLGPNSKSYPYDDPTQGGELRFRVYASNEFGASGFSNEESTLPDQMIDEDQPLKLWIFTEELAEQETAWTSYTPNIDDVWQIIVSLAVSGQQGSGGISGQAYFDNIAGFDAQGRRIFSEEFEEMQQGELSDGWAALPFLPWSEPHNFVDVPPGEANGSGAFWLEGNGPLFTGSYWNESYDGDAVAVEFDLYIPSSNGVGGIPAFFFFGEIAVIAYVDSDGSLSVRLEHDETASLNGLILDQWSRIRLELDAEQALARLVLVDESPITVELIQDSGFLVSDGFLVPAEDFRSSQIFLAPAENLSGETDIEIGLARSGVSLNKKFKLSVRPVNDPPEMDSIADQEIDEDTTFSIVLPISDVDTDLSDLMVVATSGGQNLIESTRTKFLENLGWVLILEPRENQYGEAEITIEVSDEELEVDASFTLTVRPVNDEPVIESIGTWETQEDASLEVVIPIGDPDDILEDLAVRAEANDTDLIASTDIRFDEFLETWVVTIFPRENQYGETEITVEVGDNEFEVNTSFTLVVHSVPDKPKFLTALSPQTMIQGSLSHDILVDIGDVDSGFDELVLVPTLAESGLLLGYSMIPNPAFGKVAISLTLDPNWVGRTTLELTLTDETEFSSKLSVDFTLAPGPRVFFGSIGEEGLFGLYVADDGIGTYLGWDSSRDQSIFADGFLVTSGGVFEGEEERPGGARIFGTIRGFAVSGRIGQTGSSFTGEQVPVLGPMSALVGPHEGYVGLLAGGVVRSVVGPDGKALVVLDSASASGGVMIEVDDGRTLTGNWHDSIDFRLQLDPFSRRITGQAEFAGLHWPVAGVLDPNARDSQMSNLSTRAWAGTGAQSIIAGFVVEGSEPKGLLLRGIGPGLMNYGVSGVLADPGLILKEGQIVVASNLDWELDDNPEQLAEMAQRLGGFALNPKSADSALYADLGSGRFTVVVRGEEGQEGVALVELYDATLGRESQLLNLSTRLVVREGGQAILGFVVSGSTRIQVLIRAVGPALEGFGVADVLPDPHLRIYGGSDTSVPLFENDNWAEAGVVSIGEVSVRVGAFDIDPGGRDAALLVWLDPGVYSAKVVDRNGDSGVALTELYLVP